jgi:mRNA-degrading endonuclease RelE of RelBE toxin-antitoxin system
VRSKVTKQFRAQFAALPAAVQRQAREAYQLFKANPYHPSLHFKSIRSGDPTIYSARVDIRYRVIGILEGDTITRGWIGSHADYDKVIHRL